MNTEDFFEVDRSLSLRKKILLSSIFFNLISTLTAPNFELRTLGLLNFHAFHLATEERRGCHKKVFKTITAIVEFK